MGDELEQVLRGKMLHDVLYAIPISHPIAVEFDRLTTELDQAKYDRSVKHDMAAEQIDELTKELDRLNRELEEASTIANNNYEVILKCNRQINDLKRELARYGNGEKG